MGRGHPMDYSSSDFIKLTIFRNSAGRARWVHALRATADYYGWTQEFERWIPNGSYVENGKRFVSKPDRSGWGIPVGGKPGLICWAKSRVGSPKGKTNRFRMSNSCRLVDYAELAHFTKGDWYWMTGPTGERISRDRWSAIYQTGRMV